MGLGNHLTIKSIYSEPFKAEMEMRGITDPCYLFQRWSGMILTILNQTHSDVTMNQIWEELKKQEGTIDK